MKILRLAIAPLLLGILLSWAGGTPAAAQDCQDFAERQTRLSQRQLDRNNFEGALRVLNVAVDNGCEIAIIRDQMARVMEAWYEYARSQNSSSQLQTVIQRVSTESSLRSEDRSELQSRIRSAIEDQITSTYRASDYRRTYELCRTYSQFSDRTFTLNYVCGRSALEVQALSAAIGRYEWMLDNWTAEQSYLSRQDAYEELKELYLITTRFEQGFDVAKRLAQRDASPENLLASLTAVRGQYLEPIVRVAQPALDGNPSETLRSHLNTEMKSIKFPAFVQSVYQMSSQASPEATYYGADAATPPSTDLLARSAGSVSLLLGDGDTSRAWLLTRIDDGFFVVQFDQETTVEENVILEGLLEDVGDETRWDRLWQHEFEAVYPSTGSAVATLLGGAYLADAPLRPYQEVFDAIPVLEYFCIQDKTGSLAATHAFDRSAIRYEDGVWQRSQETPALFHHTVQRGDTSLREVVWPTYQDDTWMGVVRIGITSE